MSRSETVDRRPTVAEIVAAARPLFEARGAQALIQLERTDAVAALEFTLAAGGDSVG